MEWTKTPDLNALAFSPWAMRPGASVRVTYSYVTVYSNTAWNSDVEFSITLSGTPTIKSVKGTTWPIAESSITIDGNTVNIAAINQGTQSLEIYYKTSAIIDTTSVAAITATDNTYYNDWIYDDRGVAVPMTIIPLTTIPSSEKAYDVKDFSIAYSQYETGVSVYETEVWRLNSNGTIKMLNTEDDYSISRNIFRKGKTMVEVPMACLIEPVERYAIENGSRSGKIVEMDLQEWYADAIHDIRGCLWNRDYLYVLTATGLHRFGRYDGLDIPDDTWASIIGYDLAYNADDQFLVTDGTAIKVYQIRHDFAHLDRDTETISTREPDAIIGIS